ncbi:hypothetical protein L218DRAFT_947400 [Marasmius fiardii PR-910]|nr:hypothetical protein L218DRAFT_947400 [Marasmius fiardii PR-910]
MVYKALKVAFGHKFNAVETEGADKLVRSHQNVVRSKTAIVAEGVMPYLPQTLLKYMFYLPTWTFRTLNNHLNLTEAWSKTWFADNVQGSDFHDTDTGLVGFHPRTMMKTKTTCPMDPFVVKLRPFWLQGKIQVMARRDQEGDQRGKKFQSKFELRQTLISSMHTSRKLYGFTRLVVGLKAEVDFQGSALLGAADNCFEVFDHEFRLEIA